MDYRTITSLMLRLAGVFILVQLVTSVPQAITNLLRFGGQEIVGVDALWLSAVALVLPLVIGLMLVYFPSTVANRVVRVEEPVDTGKLAESLLPVALACLGVYFVCAALFDGVYYLSRMWLYYAVVDKLRWTGPAPALTPGDFAGIASTLAQFVIGLALALGPKGLRKLVTRMRS